MNTAGRFHKVSENPLVIGFIGCVTTENLNSKQIEYIKLFYGASGKSHRMTKDFTVEVNRSLYNGFMIIED